MPDRVLVTGADGFVGRHLAPALQADGFEVVRHRRTDGDLAEVEPQVLGATRVVHLAGRTFVPESWEHPARFYRDNVLATSRVLDFCRRTGAPIVCLSSYVYGVPRGLPIAESHPLEPFNPYAHSKILAEEVVRFYAAHFGVAATIIRPFNLYGPGQDERFVIPTIVRQALDPAVPAITVHDLRPRRDYLYVADLVSIILAALRGAPGGVYNAGSGRSASVADVIGEIQRLTGTDKPVRVVGKPRAGEILDVVADVTRAREALGWRPQVSLRNGLREVVTWTRRTLATA